MRTYVETIKSTKPNLLQPPIRLPDCRRRRRRRPESAFHQQKSAQKPKAYKNDIRWFAPTRPTRMRARK